MYDFQSAMADGKARAQRERNKGRGSSVRIVSTEELYMGMTEEDWNDWQEEQASSVDDLEMDMQIAELAGEMTGEGMVAGTVDAIPAEQPFRKTMERKPGGPRTIRAQTMTPAQYAAGLSALGLTPWHAAPVLCIGVRQSYRYAAGSATVPPTVAKLLRALVKLGGDV